MSLKSGFWASLFSLSIILNFLSFDAKPIVFVFRSVISTTVQSYRASASSLEIFLNTLAIY